MSWWKCVLLQPCFCTGAGNPEQKRAVHGVGFPTSCIAQLLRKRGEKELPPGMRRTRNSCTVWTKVLSSSNHQPDVFGTSLLLVPESCFTPAFPETSWFLQSTASRACKRHRAARRAAGLGAGSWRAPCCSQNKEKGSMQAGGSSSFQRVGARPCISAQGAGFGSWEAKTTCCFNRRLVTASWLMQNLFAETARNVTSIPW